MSSGGITRKGRSQKPERFVSLPYWLLNSAAWHSLSGNAVKLHVVLIRLFNGVNNGDIYLSIRSAARQVGVAPNTVKKAFNELRHKGFLEAHTVGIFDPKRKLATTWILAHLSFDGAGPTKDFMRWQFDEGGTKPDTDGVKVDDIDNEKRG